MNVNFNNLRLNAIRDYNILVKNLNRASYRDAGTVVISIEDIQRVLGNLRGSLVTLGCCYIEGDKDCQCVLTEDMKVLELNSGVEE